MTTPLAPKPAWSKRACHDVDGMPQYDADAIDDHDDCYTFTGFWGQLFFDGIGVRGYGFDRQAHPEQKSAEIPSANDGCYGYLDDDAEGNLHIQSEGKNKFSLTVEPGCWFQCPGDISFDVPLNGRVMVVQRIGFHAMISQGRVETFGRLKYINGCHDTILSGPIKADYPVINTLHMPNGINQTMHSHPSTRVGFIIDGNANAVTPSATHPLRKGTIFFMPTNGRHKFRTDMDDKTTLRLVAFHPESGGIGPKDESHIMLNRTIVDGEGADQHPDMQTQD